MKKCKNRSNISIVRDYLNGITVCPQFGYIGDKDKFREIGEEWEDVHGKTWKKTEVGIISVNKQADFIRNLIDKKCKCGQEIKWGTKRDQYFFNRTGLCENCLIDYETKLRITGIYPDYEKYKLLSYEFGYLNDIKVKIQETIDYFSTERGDVTMICNSDGFTERWGNTNRKSILKTAKKDLRLANKRIEEVYKLKLDYKNKYEDGVKKFNLDFYV